MGIVKTLLSLHLILVTTIFIWLIYYMHDQPNPKTPYSTDVSKIKEQFPYDCNTSAIYNDWNDIPISNESLQETINWNSITYLSNASRICKKSSSIKLVTVIISAPNNTKARMRIRKTWSQLIVSSNDSVVVYMTGTSQNRDVNSKLLAEEKKFRDMLIINFDDSYRNLTLKVVLMAKWVRDFCPNAEFALKCDDDVFINVYNLFSFVHRVDPADRSFYGRLAHQVKPLRRKTKLYGTKWVVTQHEYKDKIYPDYVGGPAYLFSTVGINDLYDVAMKLPYLFLEDVFFTGMIARLVNYCRRHHSMFYNEGINASSCQILDVISVHHVLGARVVKLWNKIRSDNTYKTCKKPLPKELLT